MKRKIDFDNTNIVFRFKKRSNEITGSAYNSSNKVVGTLDAYLFTRTANTNNFHEICDEISRDLQEMSVSICDFDGNLRGNALKMTDASCSRGGLVYIDKVEINSEFQGNQNGLKFVQALLSEYLFGKWTLAVMWPTPLNYSKARPEPATPEDRKIGNISLCKHFALLGFQQLSKTDNEVCKYWILDHTKYTDKIADDSIKESIDVYTPTEVPELNESQKEITSLIKPNNESATNTIITLCKAYILKYGLENFQSINILHYAVCNKFSCLIKPLIDLGIDINKKERSGCTLLHLAAEMCDEDAIKIIIEAS